MAIIIISFSRERTFVYAARGAKNHRVSTNSVEKKERKKKSIIHHHLFQTRFGTIHDNTNQVHFLEEDLDND